MARSFGRAGGEIRPRIFLLSGVRLYREGLLWSLVRQDVFDVLGASDLTREAVSEILALKPDAIILDMGTPDGFDVARLLGASLPGAKIIAFAVSEVDDMVLACAEAGVAGYVAPDGSEADLISAVKFALRGELYCSPRIAGLLFRRVGALSTRPATVLGSDGLTQRERQILGLVGEGMSNKEIGRALSISNATVKNHVHNILEKLQVQRRGEAAARIRRSLPASARLIRRSEAPTPP